MIIIQSNFTLGELDPILFGRVDFPGYYKGAAKLRNAVSNPQGGAKVRFGTRYVGAIQGGVTDPTQCKIVKFEYGADYLFWLVLRDLHIDVYYNDALVTTISGPYTGAQIAKVKYTQTSDSVVFFHPSVPIQEFTITNPGATPTATITPITPRIQPVYDFLRNYDGATFQAGGMSGSVTVTITAGAYTPSSALIGGIFAGNEGTMRITAVTATTIVGDTITNFASLNTFSGKLSFVGEPVFTAARGYPSCGTYFQNRLFVANTTSIPNGLWGSEIGDFYNFDNSETNDTDAIATTLTSGNANVIVNLYSTSGLIALTTDGLFATPLIEGLAVTPKTIYNMTEQAQEGASDVQPFKVDNQLIYMDRGGKIVRSFSYDIQVSGYKSFNVSVQSAHLINTPIDAAYLKNSSVDDGTYVLVVNSDGTLATYQTLQEQEVSAWSLQTTDGTFCQVEAAKGQVYFLVQRTIGGSTVLYIEALDFTTRTDCASVQIFGSPTTTISGLSYLNGKTVRVRAKTASNQTNWFVLPSAVVSGGSITLSIPVTSVEVGLDYEPTIVPMPLNIPLDTGNNLYLPKRIKTIWVDYYNSNGIYIDDFLIPDDVLGTFALDTPPVPQTNFYQHTMMKGWNPRAQVTITQQDPLPFLIRGIGFEVEI